MDSTYNNVHKLKLGPLNDNKGIEHLWNISGTVAQVKQHHQIPSESRGWPFFVVWRGMFGMLERDMEVPMLSKAQN